MNAIQIATHFLQAALGVTNITTRAGIYPVKAPERPADSYLVLNLVGGRDEQMLDGPADYPEQRVRIECLAPTGGGAVTLGDAVMAALKGIKKQTIEGARDIDTRWADFDETDSGDTLSMGRRILDFYVRWRPA